MTRPSWAEVILPNAAGVLMAAAGLLKRTWLKALNASTRIWIRRWPPNSTFLKSERSVEAKPGPRIPDLELAPGQRVADEPRALLVPLARRIHRRHADQVGREGDGFVGERVDSGQDEVGEHASFLQEQCKVVKPPGMHYDPRLPAMAQAF